MRSAIRSSRARRLLRAFHMTGTASRTRRTVARWSFIGLLLACNTLPADAGNATSPSNLSAIGRQVFSDPSLSADRQVACASCHRPAQGFTDGLPLAVGVAGLTGTRNTPSLKDIAQRRSLFWDGRDTRLDEAVLRPLFNSHEHGLKSPEDLMERVRSSESLSRALSAYFGIGRHGLEASHVGQALAAYLGSLRSGSSPFDRHQQGQVNALSDSAARGLELFTGRAQCVTCHTIEGARPSLTDEAFHSVGVGMARIREGLGALVLRAAGLDGAQARRELPRDAELAALGRFVVTGDPRDIGAFRTPSLRNVALTAPYMHDGSLPTLEAVLDQELYYRGLVSGTPLVLTTDERADLIAFLHSLTEDR